MNRLRDIGEDALIERLTAGLPPGDNVMAGVGDDCAVLATADPVEYELLKTDCLVEGVHFTPDIDPRLVGRKAFCRCLSDIAAMGGEPRAALVTLAATPDHQIETVEGWYRGLREAAERYGVSLVGGETASLPENAGTALLSVAMTGIVKGDDYLLRDGGSAGDCIAVTGWLGGALSSGRHLNFEPRLAEGQFLAGLCPSRPSAMMDLSDGLAKDLPRLAKASGGLGWKIDFDALPLHEGCDIAAAIGDGEDYELLVTISPVDLEPVAESWNEEFPDLPLTVIGKLTDGEKTPLTGGWEHFKNS